MGWRYFATRMDGDGGEVLIDPDLPLSEVSITTALSGPASITATITPDMSRLIGNDGTPVFVPWSTMIYAEHNDVIHAGALVQESDDANPNLTLTCSGFSSYLNGLPYLGDWYGYKVDPMSAAGMLWNHAQTREMGNLGVTLMGNASPKRLGVRGHPALRGRPEIKDTNGEVALPALPAQPEKEDQPYVLSWYQTLDMGQEFGTLAENTPFDYMEYHRWSDRDKTDIQRVLFMQYPIRRHRRSDLRFAVGENVLEPPTLKVSGEDFASEILVLGSGEGAKMVRGSASDHSQRRLRRVAVVEAKNLTQNLSASNMARSELRFRKGAIRLDNIIVRDTPLAPFGSFGPGDEILIQASSQWHERVDRWVRVVEMSISPDKGNDMTLLVMQDGE